MRRHGPRMASSRQQAYLKRLLISAFARHIETSYDERNMERVTAAQADSEIQRLKAAFAHQDQQRWAAKEGATA